jgi:cytidine deaminase
MPTAPSASQMQALIDAALAIAEHAYAPYSNFRVGSALLLTNGEIVTGTNVENVSYGLTICAERSAIVRAIAQFGPNIRIAAAAVVNLNDTPSPPCGACRQVLAEFTDPDAHISFPSGSKGNVITITLPFREVMPFASDLQLK